MTPYGQVWKTPALRIETVAVPAGTKLSGHGHDAPHLCFLVNGQFEERCGPRKRTVDAGILRCSPGGDEHDLVFNTGSSCLLFLFDGAPAAIKPRLLDKREYVSNPRIDQLMAELAAGMDSTTDSSPLEIEILALELAAATQGGNQGNFGRAPNWLLQVREKLRSFPNLPPTSQELAQETGFHPVYVARAFRQCFGLGLSEYSRVERASYARKLLRQSDLPIAEIAAHAGYADQSHMGRALGRLLNATPAMLRRCSD